jgi:hypothetical protein
VTTVPLRELATVIRSKNAGPFRLTMDVLFDSEERFETVRRAGAITAESVAAQYGVAVDRISSVYCFPMGRAFKVTFIRPTPQGAIGDSDMYGCQQHAPLLDLPVELTE